MRHDERNDKLNSKARKEKSQGQSLNNSQASPKPSQGVSGGLDGCRSGVSPNKWACKRYNHNSDRQTIPGKTSGDGFGSCGKSKPLENHKQKQRDALGSANASQRQKSSKSKEPKELVKGPFLYLNLGTAGQRRNKRLRRAILNFYYATKYFVEYWQLKGVGSRAFFITLTYRPNVKPSDKHFLNFLDRLRKYMTRTYKGYTWDELGIFLWVRELQDNGNLHYHMLLVVPDFVYVPYPDTPLKLANDKKGKPLWPYGMSNVMFMGFDKNQDVLVEVKGGFRGLKDVNILATDGGDYTGGLDRFEMFLRYSLEYMDDEEPEEPEPDEPEEKSVKSQSKAKEKAKQEKSSAGDKSVYVKTTSYNAGMLKLIAFLRKHHMRKYGMSKSVKKYYRLSNVYQMVKDLLAKVGVNFKLAVSGHKDSKANMWLQVKGYIVNGSFHSYTFNGWREIVKFCQALMRGYGKVEKWWRYVNARQGSLFGGGGWLNHAYLKDYYRAVKEMFDKALQELGKVKAVENRLRKAFEGFDRDGPWQPSLWF